MQFNFRNNRVKIITYGCLIVAAVCFVIFTRRESKISSPKSDKLEQTTPNTKSGLLTKESTEMDDDNYYEKREHQIQEADLRELIEEGLKDPINDLVHDLMNKNYLIPCEGSVGGKPGFYNPDRIAVLSKDHVIADYDDGHAEGTIELSFIVSKGTISWKVVQAECGS